MRRRADLTAVLDACYASEPDAQRWARDLASVLGRALEGNPSLGIIAVEHDATLSSQRPLISVEPAGGLGTFNFDSIAGLPDEAAMLRSYFYPPEIVTTHGRIERNGQAQISRRMAGYRHEMGVDDLFGLVVHPHPQLAVAVFGELPAGVQIDRVDRERLTQIALHIESGLRMRYSAGATRAVLAPNGNVLELLTETPLDPRMSGSTRAVDTARAEQSPDAWTALVAGEVSVVPRLRGDRRVYELVENAPAARRFRALSRREVDVLALAARGLTVKLCAYALGLSPAAISTLLASAAAKIGAMNRIELLRISALLGRSPLADADDLDLTKAEREILALVGEGLSNAQIAQRRGRSIRTIANQIATLLAKTGSSSRRELAVRGARRR